MAGAMTAAAMLAAFAARELSPVEVLPGDEGPHGAWAARCPRRALEEARAAEAAWRHGEPTGPLCGVPFAVKDLLDTAGVETACGSALLAGRVPDRDAAAVARLRASGAVLAGKTTTVEFAWGLMMRTARNPHDAARTPGGSSGGSAIAVATGAVPLALGTDTGGSIRLPAAFCGVVGFKPARGAVPAAGCWPLAPDRESIGPLARDVADVRLMYAMLAADAAGGDGAAGPVDGVRVGVPRDLGLELEPGVGAALDAAADRLAAAGVRLVAVDVPSPAEVMAAYVPRFFEQALAVHTGAGLWPARRDGYTPAVRRRLELAEAQPEAALAAGDRATARVRSAYAAVWERADALLTPACATAPPRLDGDGPDLRAVASPLLCPQNLLGLPACAVPAGADASGLPIGVQLSGPDAARVLDLAAALDDLTELLNC